MPKRLKRIMRKFTINEISGVDVPAQTGARALIMKRDDRAHHPGTVKKDDVVEIVTGIANGHQHGINIRKYSDGDLSLYVNYALAEGDEATHDHALVRDGDGGYTVSQNSGHTHTIDSAALNAAIVAVIQKAGKQEDTDMDSKELEALKAKTERLEKVVALSGDHRTYFDALEGDETKDAFLAKSADGRTAEIEEVAKKLNAEDPVAYTTSAGVEIRKSAGETAVLLAKSLDVQSKEIDVLKADNAKLAGERDSATFEKRASAELPHLPGSLAVRGALLKAAESIEDEKARDGALAALKAQNTALSYAFMNKGAGAAGEIESTVDADDPQAKLDALAKEYQKSHDGVSIEQAHAEVMFTPEGERLYNEIQKAGSTEPHVESLH